MTAHMPITTANDDDRRLQWLMEAVERNRFIPSPELAKVFVGDGDFRAIGAEFLGHLVRIGGLQPGHRVLDIGSGIGRIAAPLTQYLAPSASYLGIDPERSGITWCKEHITSVYPNFQFRHIDVAHRLYNPAGLLRGETLVLPVGDNSVDFIAMISIVTHLPAAEIITYCHEIARVLAPGGTCFVTSFAVDKANANGLGRDARCAFTPIAGGPAWSGKPTDPLAMIAYDEGWLEQRLLDAGLTSLQSHRGRWRGIEAPHFQDIVVARKASETK